MASGTSIAAPTDNASNMVAAFGGSKWKRIYCMAHMLNLGVEDGLKKSEVQKPVPYEEEADWKIWEIREDWKER